MCKHKLDKLVFAVIIYYYVPFFKKALKKTNGNEKNTIYITQIQLNKILYRYLGKLKVLKHSSYATLDECILADVT